MDLVEMDYAETEARVAAIVTPEYRLNVLQLQIDDLLERRRREDLVQRKEDYLRAMYELYLQWYGPLVATALAAALSAGIIQLTGAQERARAFKRGVKDEHYSKSA